MAEYLLTFKAHADKSIRQIAQVTYRLLPVYPEPSLPVGKVVNAKGRVAGCVVGEVLHRYGRRYQLVPTGYRGERSIYVKAGKHPTPAKAKALAESMLRGFEAGMKRQSPEQRARRRTQRRAGHGVTIAGQ